jgi:glycerate kinase
MMRHLCDKEGVKRIVLGSGGSAFVDGGLGAIIGTGIFNIETSDSSLPPEKPYH